ncbi:class I SAM-dependent methyltransferase [Helicobacter jaachi]|uniref:Class I SAM-dependent methyltransferase n=1 Tax=Helicobacter jaachi TaxID=1677920 RepID=A0A4U8T5R3_9HELI|nr:class I SAM-dependent methyltransferase [Helicobacter jaachi]TLD94875.1 class I SAM-dependent methyltransferase [Helicobacter jaachi]
MLYSFIKNFPHAETYAYDVSRHNEHLFWEIPNFSRFWDNVEAIEGRFDCITLIHCLEHIGDIRKTASKLYTLLKDSGVVIIQVPDVAQNMWDIFTYDHCHHFSFYTLYKLFIDAGFYVSLPHHQIARQITLLASKQPLKQGIENPDMFYFDCKHLNDVLALLESLRTNGSSGGVFGTTISTFVALVLGEWAQCFYDEDKRKIGKTHLGLPIVSPSEGDGCEIVMPLGESLYAKLSAKYPKHHFIRAF